MCHHSELIQHNLNKGCVVVFENWASTGRGLQSTARGATSSLLQDFLPGLQLEVMLKRKIYIFCLNKISLTYSVQSSPNSPLLRSPMMALLAPPSAKCPYSKHLAMGEFAQTRPHSAALLFTDRAWLGPTFSLGSQIVIDSSKSQRFRGRDPGWPCSHAHLWIDMGLW